MGFRYSVWATFVWSFVFIEMVCPGIGATLESADEDGTFLGQTEPRKKNNQDDFLKKITPMIATPFIMQTTFLPFALILMKMFLGMSMFLGKLGIVIWIFNILHNRMDTSGHLYSHNINIH
nr:unnamed protein product [Callosobruchus chinensis]